MEQKIGKQRANQTTKSLGELEAIVVNIFDSFGGGAKSMRGPQQPKSRPPSSWCLDEDISDNGEVWKEPGPPPESALQHQRRRRPPPAPIEQVEVPANGGDTDAETARDQGYLLDEEEEKFVEQTVVWLSSRANPDILLDCIWNRLIDLPEEQEANLASSENPVPEPDHNRGEEGNG